MVLAKALSKANLAMNSIDAIELRFPEMIAGLGNKSVDLAKRWAGG